MKSINIRVDENKLQELDEICKLEKRTRAELIRIAIDKILDDEQEFSKQLIELQEQNKQLKIAAKSMDMVLKEKDEKYNMVNEIKEQQKSLYENVLDQKDTTIKDIKSIIDHQEKIIDELETKQDHLKEKVNNVNNLNLFQRLFFKPVNI